MKGIVGKKLGMTQLFDEESGSVTSVTVIEAGPCPVVAVRTPDGEYVRSRGIKTGVVCCFKKPVDMKVLGETIRTNHELRQESMRLELAEDVRRRK